MTRRILHLTPECKAGDEIRVEYAYRPGRPVVADVPVVRGTRLGVTDNQTTYVEVPPCEVGDLLVAFRFWDARRDMNVDTGWTEAGVRGAVGGMEYGVLHRLATADDVAKSQLPDSDGSRYLAFTLTSYHMNAVLLTSLSAGASVVTAGGGGVDATEHTPATVPDGILSLQAGFAWGAETSLNAAGSVFASEVSLVGFGNGYTAANLATGATPSTFTTTAPTTIAVIAAGVQP